MATIVHPDKGRSIRDRKLFDQIASQYASKDLYPPSSRAWRLRLTQTLRFAGTMAALDILEVGCGAGFSATYLKGQCRSFTGIDYSSELISLAVRDRTSANTRFHAADLTTFSSEQQFDCVLMIGVLHHMPDIIGALKAMVGLAKPGGLVAVNEPQASNPIIHSARVLRSRIDKSYSPEQEELPRARLISLFGEAGLREIQAVPQGIFSTVFAEVQLKPEILAGPASRLACAADRLMEAALPWFIAPLSWNVIVAGRRPL